MEIADNFGGRVIQTLNNITNPHETLPGDNNFSEVRAIGKQMESSAVSMLAMHVNENLTQFLASINNRSQSHDCEQLRLRTLCPVLPVSDVNDRTPEVRYPGVYGGRSDRLCMVPGRGA